MAILDERGRSVPLVDLDGNKIPVEEHDRMVEALLATTYFDGREVDAFVRRGLEAYREQLKV